jgi:hypothetical protein
MIPAERLRSLSAERLLGIRRGVEKESLRTRPGGSGWRARRTRRRWARR